MTTTHNCNCTLWIRRSFGTDFALSFASQQEAWVSAINIIKEIEYIENRNLTVFTSWDIVTGKATSYSNSLANMPTQITKFWTPYSNSIAYPIAEGNSFQLFLVKGHGLTNIPFYKNNKIILMSETEAIHFLNENDDSIDIIKTKSAKNVYRPVY